MITSAGPGREIILNGFSALILNRPDMNTLVGLGATASFGVSCVAAAMPHLGWKTFFEEPAMLVGRWPRNWLGERERERERKREREEKCR